MSCSRDPTSAGTISHLGINWNELGVGRSGLAAEENKRKINDSVDHDRARKKELNHDRVQWSLKAHAFQVESYSIFFLVPCRRLFMSLCPSVGPPEITLFFGQRPPIGDKIL